MKTIQILCLGCIASVCAMFAAAADGEMGVQRQRRRWPSSTLQWSATLKADGMEADGNRLTG